MALDGAEFGGWRYRPLQCTALLMLSICHTPIAPLTHDRVHPCDPDCPTSRIPHPHSSYLSQKTFKPHTCPELTHSRPPPPPAPTLHLLSALLSQHQSGHVPTPAAGIATNIPQQLLSKHNTALRSSICMHAVPCNYHQSHDFCLTINSGTPPPPKSPAPRKPPEISPGTPPLPSSTFTTALSAAIQPCLHTSRSSYCKQ